MSKETAEVKKERSRLLPGLKEAAGREGQISKTVMTEVAGCSCVPLNEAYAVASFYA
jgi:NADH:ubiquinone oxidoreductase subunit E